MAASIKDVAALAGVSSATVSHVMNGTRFVSEPTQHKVLAAIETLQYSPNILARKFKTGSLDTVGVIVPDIANGYFATLIEEVEDVLQSSGFRMLVSNTHEDLARELDSLKMLSSGVVDGFVIASTADDFSKVAAVLPANFPVVLVDREMRNADVDMVVTENSTAISEGVYSLVRAGHEKIGLMASVRHLSTTQERVKAYRETLEGLGITSDPELIRYLDSLSDPVQPDAQFLVDRGCTAIVASNNVLSTKLLAMVHSSSGPGPLVDVLGYRDPLHYVHLRDGASWLEEPIAEMGRLAGQAIVDRIAAPRSQSSRFLLHASYVPYQGSNV